MLKGIPEIADEYFEIKCLNRCRQHTDEHTICLSISGGSEDEVLWGLSHVKPH